MENDIYPMPMFVQLQVSDLERSAHWYTEVVGFHTIFAPHGPDEKLQMLHIRRARYQDIMLIPSGQQDVPLAGGGAVLYFQFWEDWDALNSFAERIRAASTSAIEGPFDTPWNTREIRLRDPDGYRLIFSKGPLKEGSLRDLFGETT